MPIKLLHHAKKRLRQRGIPKSLIYRIIEKPNDVIIQERGTKIYVGKYSGEKIFVVVFEQKRQIVVISVYYEKK